MFNRRLVRRKWGWYLTILDRKHFKVKLLRFKKGHALSMQYHMHRSELWLVLSGYGHMFYEGIKHLIPGSYVNIKETRTHKFVAESRALVLEIQYGEQCVESDIVRL